MWTTTKNSDLKCICEKMDTMQPLSGSTILCKYKSRKTNESDVKLSKNLVHQHFRIKCSLSSLIKLSHFTFIFILVNVIIQETNGQQTGRKKVKT
jgi:hypothetical protein